MQQNYLYDEMDYKDRLELLRKMSIGRETMTFKRSLTPEDLVDRKDLFARDNMRLATMKEDFKELKARKTADIKALEKSLEESLEVIANGSLEVFDETFLIPNYDKGLILFVDKHGEIVHQREIKQEERQGRLMLDDGPPNANDQQNGGEVTDVEFEEIKLTGGEQEPGPTTTAATEDGKGTEPGGQIPPGKKKRAPRKKKEPVKEGEPIVEQPEGTTTNNEPGKGIYSTGSEADPDAMDRLKDWDHTKES